MSGHTKWEDIKHKKHMHELKWKRTPKGTVRLTPWGWQAACVCGWSQDLPAGTKKYGIKLYHAHKSNLPKPSAPHNYVSKPF